MLSRLFFEFYPTPSELRVALAHMIDRTLLSKFLMRIHASKPLLPWDELEISPTLATIRQTLESIPDEAQ